ncbi:MAG: helix-turn-helix transcriptional regulator, partial [Thermoguttaceae bacterium]
RRSIQRHFSQFRANGLPLIEDVTDSKIKKYRIMLHETALRFTLDEVIAVYTGRLFLEPMMGSYFWEAMQSALKKMRQSLGTQLIRFLERSIGTFGRTEFGWSDYQGRGEMLDDLATAIENQQCVVILYQSLQDSEPSRTKVSPYGLIHHDGSLYLVGFSHKRNGVRHWKVDRMQGVTRTGEAFSGAGEFDLQEHISSLFGIFSEEKGKSQQTVRIRFDSVLSGPIREKHWHKTERFLEEADGRVVLEFEVSNLQVVKRWLLSHGRHAEVLGPSELIDLIRSEASQMAALYGG